LYRQFARFDCEGMASLFGPTKTEKHHRLPHEIREHILALKAEHPPLRVHEITTICRVRFGHRPSPHAVKHLLAEAPLLRGVEQAEHCQLLADPPRDGTRDSHALGRGRRGRP